jgi:hypothetical protein
MIILLSERFSGLGASDCDSDMNFEGEKGERMIVTKYSNGDIDMEGSSVGAVFLK